MNKNFPENFPEILRKPTESPQKARRKPTESPQKARKKPTEGNPWKSLENPWKILEIIFEMISETILEKNFQDPSIISRIHFQKSEKKFRGTNIVTNPIKSNGPNPAEILKTYSE